LDPAERGEDMKKVLIGLVLLVAPLAQAQRVVNPMELLRREMMRGLIWQQREMNLGSVQIQEQLNQHIVRSLQEEDNGPALQVTNQEQHVVGQSIHDAFIDAIKTCSQKGWHVDTHDEQQGLVVVSVQGARVEIHLTALDDKHTMADIVRYDLAGDQETGVREEGSTSQ
jgi:hypothetical protein